MTISSGAFIVGAGGYNPNSVDGITDARHVNFPAGSTGSWTLNGADQTTFETLYTDGTLLLDGDRSAPFASVFSVSGNTISVIPEPSVAILTLLGGLLFLRRRR